MLSSMTGFGKAEIKQDGVSVSVEVKSLNSRFLEVIPKIPRILQSREFEIRELIRRKIARGKITILIDLEIDPAYLRTFEVNFDIVNHFVKLLREIKKKAKVKGEIKLEHLLMFREIFESGLTNDISDEHWEIVKSAIDEALDKLVEARKKEGLELSKDIENRINLISDHLEKILTLSEQSLKNKQSTLKQKIEKIFEDVEFDKNRLEMELVLLADKLDVTEECVRLKSHLKFFLETLKSDEVAVGRRLNFLLQEMLREATTIGAKTEDAEITYLVIAVKEEIEKIREQLQNIE
ncbi:TIGR00255 family protein [Candidatus Kryptonium thompsonii]|uniref:TIGR00255 family protein n=3 Tax=Candidatus Kryptonium thompsonii TaxID=1633631 RepID=A0A0P1P1V7_9BACT|nr:YicC/YloC family endoribonuclease [Candidatus Kryptonium thompsoni]CUS77742.1 TIGR00255 family protein [Candidatus Kryptonium thompsoni]CUS90711.1 TIGR00255 family protein [Candidatus Kryptonium thompsoni]CUS93270.1 TIGR00255 family protein [Candidatus Kryptonium thompsoni]CUS93408.1 TIGR00255 family protein [Candidatus Kryptonium thompsoni]CUT00342.1 TIGR00255 family protein [Candidatus Kryptonium thompsoni]